MECLYKCSEFCLKVFLIPVAYSYFLILNTNVIFHIYWMFKLFLDHITWTAHFASLIFIHKSHIFRNKKSLQLFRLVYFLARFSIKNRSRENFILKHILFFMFLTAGKRYNK